LLPPEDPSLWASVIREVLIDPARAANLRRRGFARAKEFSWLRAAQATREVYREALLA
jgi:glycosyltransferase involved in cell wall biosynthesis